MGEFKKRIMDELDKFVFSNDCSNGIVFFYDVKFIVQKIKDEAKQELSKDSLMKEIVTTSIPYPSKRMFHPLPVNKYICIPYDKWVKWFDESP